MNEKEVGATGKESLWEAVRRGLAGSTLKLTLPYPLVTNTFIHKWLRVSGLILVSTAGASGGKQQQLEFWGEAAPSSFLTLQPPKWVVPQLLICETGTTVSPSQGCQHQLRHTGPAWLKTGTQGTLQKPVSTLCHGE